MAAVESMSDVELLAQMVQGDRESLRHFYRRYDRLVYSCALRVVRDSALAEEVTQDVFVKVWEKAATYRAEKASVVTWLWAMARNRSIDVLRSHTRTGSPRPWDLESRQDLEPSLELDQSEDQRKVKQALETLGPDQRKALLLAFYQGKTHREIADHLKEPLGTIKTRIRDALLKLRDQLSERQEE